MTDPVPYSVQALAAKRVARAKGTDTSDYLMTRPPGYEKFHGEGILNFRQQLSRFCISDIASYRFWADIRTQFQDYYLISHARQLGYSCESLGKDSGGWVYRIREPAPPGEQLTWKTRSDIIAAVLQAIADRGIALTDEQRAAVARESELRLAPDSSPTPVL